MAHIFVLDDVLDAAVLTQRILSKKGHQVTIFTDEQEAMRYAMENQVDLAILDINLKKTNGISVLAALRRANPKIRVIMLTGYPTVETARKALHLGAADYCVKPIDKSELEQKVSAALAN
ncbi:response regulator [Thiovibrio frasassiensis]|uniref:Response regulator n=1 Tax=Thiovibrio frasassiensis TaxID=2984131 RepID=A0A9X4MG88_9BACT|nr:response regulator [Thiovibrio frasassiensis]MDG4475781.1 response regulator [Thiovibrio frasassiensis]